MAFRSERLEDKGNRTISCLLCEHTITAEVNLLPQNMWYMAHDYQNEILCARSVGASLREPAAHRIGSFMESLSLSLGRLTLACAGCARGDLSGCVLLQPLPYVVPCCVSALRLFGCMCVCACVPACPCACMWFHAHVVVQARARMHTHAPTRPFRTGLGIADLSFRFRSWLEVYGTNANGAPSQSGHCRESAERKLVRKSPGHIARCTPSRLLCQTRDSSRRCKRRQCG